MLSTIITLPFVIKTFVLSILSGRFTQVSLYKLLSKLRTHSFSGEDSDQTGRMTRLILVFGCTCLFIIFVLK